MINSGSETEGSFHYGSFKKIIIIQASNAGMNGG